MKFKSQEQRLQWLKGTAIRIQQMEQERKICIMRGDFKQAFLSLKGIKFARREFARESRSYEKRKNIK